jgi:hypothetical protein
VSVVDWALNWLGWRALRFRTNRREREERGSCQHESASSRRGEGSMLLSSIVTACCLRTYHIR